MQKPIQEASDEAGRLAQEAQAFMTATADVAGEKVAEARKRLSEALMKGRETFDRAKGKAIEVANKADETIHDNPYQVIGIAFGIGALLGYLATRRCCRNND